MIVHILNRLRLKCPSMLSILLVIHFFKLLSSEYCNSYWTSCTKTLILVHKYFIKFSLYIFIKHFIHLHNPQFIILFLEIATSKKYLFILAWNNMFVIMCYWNKNIYFLFKLLYTFENFSIQFYIKQRGMVKMKLIIIYAQYCI